MHQAAPGKVVFHIENGTAELGLVCIAQLPPGFDINTIPLKFVPFLNGKRVLTTQTFRDLFRSEVIKATEGIGVKNITLLFTDLKGSTNCTTGSATSMPSRSCSAISSAARRHGPPQRRDHQDHRRRRHGPFSSLPTRCKAALAMRSEIAAFNASQPDRALILKIGIHKGAAIAVTLNERLDYFGQNVNIAARIQGIAEAGEIYLSEDVHADEEARRSSPRCRCNRPSRNCAACVRIFASFVSGASNAA